MSDQLRKPDSRKFGSLLSPQGLRQINQTQRRGRKNTDSDDVQLQKAIKQSLQEEIKRITTKEKELKQKIKQKQQQLKNSKKITVIDLTEQQQQQQQQNNKQKKQKSSTVNKQPQDKKQNSTVNKQPQVKKQKKQTSSTVKKQPQDKKQKKQTSSTVKKQQDKHQYARRMFLQKYKARKEKDKQSKS